MIRLVVAAGAIAAIAASSTTAPLVTTGHAASVGRSAAPEAKTEPAASARELKAQYRRPPSIPLPEHDRYTVC